MLRYALTIEPECESLLLNLAVELSRSERNDEAIELMQRSLKKFPNHARMWLNLGSFQFEAGQFDSAIESSRRALALAPEKALAWWNISCAYAQKGKRDECLTALENCLEIFPDLVTRVPNEESFRPYLSDPAFVALLSSN